MKINDLRWVRFKVVWQSGCALTLNRTLAARAAPELQPWTSYG